MVDVAVDVAPSIVDSAIADHAIAEHAAEAPPVAHPPIFTANPEIAHAAHHAAHVAASPFWQGAVDFR